MSIHFLVSFNKAGDVIIQIIALFQLIAMLDLAFECLDLVNYDMFLLYETSSLLIIYKEKPYRYLN